MEIFTLKRSSINNVMPVLQVLLLFGYFTLNIINVGEMGTALPLLAGFVALAGLALFADAMRRRLTVKVHFLVFILFVAWVSFRMIIDLQDLEYLKQVKDYRHPDTEQMKPSALGEVVALKVRDTLAGLVAASFNANDQQEKELAK